MKIRIATFNLENLDDVPGKSPTLDERIRVLKPQLNRLKADIICFQEIHGQETPNQPRDILALKKLLSQTPYSAYAVSCTKTSSNEVYNERNLVTASRFPVLSSAQYNNTIVKAPSYKTVTALPIEKNEVKDVKWERPIFHLKLDLGNGKQLHVINLHLKSRRPKDIDGQKVNNYTWRSGAGWAEGSFLSAMKRVGQALETRILLDQIFDAEPEALIVVCGDFNAHPDEVPVEAIRGSVENTDNPDLYFRELIPCEHTIPETSRYTYIHKGQKRMLDHMLISRGMMTHYSHSEIHNETLHDESISFATDKKFPESDHAPFIAEFEI